MMQSKNSTTSSKERSLLRFLTWILATEQKSPAVFRGDYQHSSHVDKGPDSMRGEIEQLALWLSVQIIEKWGDWVKEFVYSFRKGQCS